MRHRKIMIVFVLFVCTVANVQAQQGVAKLSVGFNAGMPVGAFKDNISETSYRGFKASVLYGITDQLSVGLGTGFQDFYQKNPRKVYQFSDGSDVSAVLSHSIQTIPLLVQGKYLLSTEALVQPYAALGIGGNLILFTEMLGEFGGSQTKFGFAARPEAGICIPFRKGGEAGAILGASYNIMPFNYGTFSNLNHVGVHAGVTFPMRR